MLNKTVSKTPKSSLGAFASLAASLPPAAPPPPDKSPADFFDKKTLEKFEDEAVFLKGTGKANVESAQKAALNRRGNVLFNDGDVEAAKRIFITTGYSDGLIRVGDFYKGKGRVADALRMYWAGGDKKKASEICMEFAIFIKGLMKEDESGAGKM